jgi:hypothetical protein
MAAYRSTVTAEYIRLPTFGTRWFKNTIAIDGLCRLSPMLSTESPVPNDGTKGNPGPKAAANGTGVTRATRGRGMLARTAQIAEGDARSRSSRDKVNAVTAFASRTAAAATHGAK